MAAPESVSVVIPAFNEADGIAAVVEGLRAAAAWCEILVVDDGSTDGTAANAERAGARVIRHPYNKGNGAAVKSGLRGSVGEHVLIIDADGQHQPQDAIRLVSRLGEYDLVVGARSSETQATAVRRAGNIALNRLAGYLTEHDIPDLTSGFRAARRDQFLEFIHLLPNGFSTPTTTTMCFLKAGYSVIFEPVHARPRVGVSKIRLSRDGPKFLLIILRIITIFSPWRLFLPLSMTLFLVGGAYGVWTVWTQRHVTNSSVLLITLSVVVLLVGLISEQISALRFDGRK